MTNTVKVGDRIRTLDGSYRTPGVGVVTAVLEDGVAARFGGQDQNNYLFTGGFEVVPPARPATLAEQVDGHAAVPTTAAPSADAVFRPAHYVRYAIEPITFITANSLGFLPGNVVKYVLRHDAKNGVEDLKKARRYIDIMIEDLERRARGEALKVETV